MLLTYLSGHKSAGAILHAAVSAAREKCGLLAEGTSSQPSAKLAANNSETLSQSAPPASAEHPANEIAVNPIVSMAIDENKTQSSGSAPAIRPLPEPASELVSALGQPVADEGDAEQGTDGQSGGGTPGELLTLLDKMTGGDTPDAVLPEDDPPPVAALQPADISALTPGEHFWAWLVDSIEAGSLSVNAQDSLLHGMAQYVFIQTPDCFYRYLGGQGNTEGDKDEVQKSFEVLNRHFSKSGKGIYIYRKYENESREGRFTRMSGYMILASQLFKQGVVLSDSLWLSPNK
ncbi:DNA-binding domain-containing protein [Rahnella sp. BCC 1045]|nr:DNA-binding domain-containing protein [Rahnella sp. BCC 1045]